ncbi:MAG: TolB family protein, partial [Anaerolineales bacterium]
MGKYSSPCGPCGAWPSPIDAQLVSQAGTGSAALPREIRVDAGAVYWIEFQPDQDARYTIMRWDPAGEIECLTPAGFSVRSRVHEYGGGAYAVHQKRIFFVNDSDQAIYEQADQGGLVRLFQDEPDHKIRFADLEASPDGSWLVAVRERHFPESPVINDLVAISLTGDRKILPLAQGRDFYAAPRFDPTGTRLCWLSWNHPNMPWDATALHTARFEQKGTLEEVQLVAGGMDESIFQPEWSPVGELFFVSDRTGWWNIYRVVDGAIHAVLPMEAEFGRPAWLLGFSSYAFVSGETIAAVYKQDGRPELGLIDIKTGSLQPIETGFTSFELPSIAFAPP